MERILTILGCSIVSMFIGTLVLALFLGGWYAALASPLLMVFGWFYFPVILMLSTAAVYGWRLFINVSHGRVFFVVLGMVGASILFALIGIKAQGSEGQDTLAYAVASSVAAFISCMWISSRGVSPKSVIHLRNGAGDKSKSR